MITTFIVIAMEKVIMQWQMVSNDWGGIILLSGKSSRSRSLHNKFNRAFLESGYKLHTHSLEIEDS